MRLWWTRLKFVALCRDVYRVHAVLPAVAARVEDGHDILRELEDALGPFAEIHILIQSTRWGLALPSLHEAQQQALVDDRCRSYSAKSLPGFPSVIRDFLGSSRKLRIKAMTQICNRLDEFSQEDIALLDNHLLDTNTLLAKAFATASREYPNLF